MYGKQSIKTYCFNKLTNDNYVVKEIDILQDTCGSKCTRRNVKISKFATTDKQ